MPPATLLGVEHEYQLDPVHGPIDFRQLIHTLDIEGARLDPGDVHAYRLRFGAVLTADGVTAEVATPPVPLTANCADTLIDLQQAGLRELERVLPADTPIFGYSTHISVSVPDELNDKLCALYARTFGPALIFQFHSIQTEGIYIRPRPGRIEFCGNYLSDDRLRSAVTFAGASVEACLASLRGAPSALAALPDYLELVIEADPIRYGLHLSANSFTAGAGSRDQDLLLHSSDGTTTTLGESLQRSWQAVQPFLPPPPPTSEASHTEHPTRPASDLESPGSPGGAAVASRPTTANLGQNAVAAYGAILDRVERPRYSVSAAVAVWDFTVFQVSAPARSAYVAVPRTELPSFWAELKEGDHDAQIEAFLETEAGSHVLRTNDQTHGFGLWDHLAVGQQLLAPERLPSPQALGLNAHRIVRPSNDVGGTSKGPRPAAGGDTTGPATTSTVATTEDTTRPGKRPRILVPAPPRTSVPAGDPPTPIRAGRASRRLSSIRAALARSR